MMFWQDVDGGRNAAYPPFWETDKQRELVMMKHLPVRDAAAVLACLLVPVLCMGEYVWWEAEDAESRTFSDKARWSVMEGPGFSGDKAIHISANESAVPDEGLSARWKINVPKNGKYEFWARIGYRPWNPHQWRLDGGPWQTSHPELGFYEFHKVPTGDSVTEMSWMTYGRVDVAAGDHTFDIRMTRVPGKTYLLQNFDCFVLSADPFIPAGQYKPDAAVPVRPMAGSPATSEWWPFRPTVQRDAAPALDLSFMNAPLDKRGFVSMRDGDLFFEDGTPVRFWGMNAGYWQGHMIYMEHLDAERFAEHLARLGYNCVRIHILHAANSLIDKTRDDTQHFDPVKLDRLMYLVHALAERNVYVNIDLMFHRTFKAGDGVGPELIPPENGKKDEKYNVSWACGAAAHWHPRVIELNLALQKQLLTYRNPYSGKSLAESPQMAMCTIQNEQSIFWGTTNLRRGKTGELLEELYNAWLRDKYGSHAQLATAWKIEGKPAAPLTADENLDEGTVKLGHVVERPNGMNDKRADDQVRFLYHVETSFYTHVIEQMRSWGIKCPIITSNWRGGLHTTRLVLQASTLGEIVDRHTYFTRPESMLSAVGKGIPMTGFDQQADRAFCISEWNHGTKGLFIPETVPLMAAVAALQGWDVLFQFAAGSPTWETGIGGLRILPGHFALSPIAAMIFRRGDVTPGPLVFERRRDPGFQFSFAPESRTATTDPAALRFAGGDEKAEPRVPPEILAVGRVQNAYVSKPTPDLLEDDLLQQAWDREKKVVTSATRELEWHYGEQWLRVDTTRTQGAFGALAGKNVSCRDVTIESPNECAAIIVTALEEKPIPDASRLLIAAVGRQQPNALAAEGPYADTAAPPCLVEPVLGTVSIRTPLKRVYALSATGYRLHAIEGTRSDEKMTLRLTGKPNVMYYELCNE